MTSLDCLPPEVIIAIGLELSLSSVVRLSQASRRLNSILCDNKYFWYCRYLKDFGKSEHIPTSWKDLYYRTLYNTVWTFGLIWTGNNVYRIIDIPSPRIKLETVVSRVTSGHCTAIIDVQNNVWMRGRNAFGELGLGDRSYIPFFTQIPEVKADSAACGRYHTLLLTPEGTLLAFGKNENGRLGLGNYKGPTDVPVTVPSPRTKAVGAGDSHSVLIDLEGRVWATGENYKGQLGLGYRSPPVESFVRTNLHGKTLSVGSNFTIIVDPSGKLWSFGENKYGQLGLGFTNDSVATPTCIPGIRAKSVFCGHDYTIVLTSDGTVLGTGCNATGQLGLGSLYETSTFIPLGVPKAKKIATSGDATTIIDLEGNVWIFGQIMYRAEGVSTPIKEPVKIPGIIGREIAIGWGDGIIVGKHSVV